MTLTEGMSTQQARAEIEKYPYRTRIGRVFALSFFSAITTSSLAAPGLGALIQNMDDAFAEEGMGADSK